MNKTNYFLFSLITFSILFFSCKKENHPNQVGTWHVEENYKLYQDGELLYDFDNSFELVIKSDGTGVQSKSNSTDEFEWLLNDNDSQITISKINNPSNIGDAGKYDITRNTADFQKWSLEQSYGFLNTSGQYFDHNNIRIWTMTRK